MLDFFCEAATFETLYILCDICEPEFVLDSVRPLLRIINESGEVTNIHFKPVQRQQIKRIHVCLRNRNFEIPSNPIGRVRMTIALEEIV